MRVLGRALRFGDPDAADIVIFDEVNSDVVREALPADCRVSVLKVRPEDLRIGPRVLWYCLQFLTQLRWRVAARHPRGVPAGFLSQIRCIYLEACLTAIKPKAVVTFIDNSGPFGWLSRHCRRFPLFAIQNGSRLSCVAEAGMGYYLQHLFCFGEHEAHLFPTIGYEVETFHPVGSLFASLHWEESVPPASEGFDLLVVSSWRGNIGFTQDVQDSMRSMKIMDRLLAEYIDARRLKAAVILRNERNGPHWMMPELGLTEEEYFRQIYGEQVTIADADFRGGGIFPIMQRSRMIVSYFSTAVLEAFGIGKKVLCCNFTGTDRYHRDLNPAIVTNDSDRDAFFARLDVLRRTPDAEYVERHRALQNYYMSYPNAGSTRQAIADTIAGIMRQSAGVSA